MPTDDELRELRQEAAQAGDAEMVRICDAALDGNDSARDECAKVIRAARELVELDENGEELDVCYCGRELPRGLCGRCGEVPHDCECPNLLDGA